MKQFMSLILLWAMVFLHGNTMTALAAPVGDFDPTLPPEPNWLIPVTVSSDPDSVAYASGTGMYLYNSSVYISTSGKKKGYTFQYWTRNGVKQSYSSSFYYTVTDTVAFVAHYAYDPVLDPPFDPTLPPEPDPLVTDNTRAIYLTCEPAAGGSFNRSNGAMAEIGSSVTCIVYPNQNYTFLGWYQGEECVCTTTSYEFTMPNTNVSLTAKLEYNPGLPQEPQAKDYNLNYQLDGTIVRTEKKIYGDTIVAWEPDEKEGYTFSGWSNVPVYMPKQDVTLVGTYIDNNTIKLEVTSSSAGHGTVTRSNTSTTLVKGANLTLTATPDEGYHFEKWVSGSGDESTTNPLSFKVSKDESWTAYFAVNTHIITYKIGGITTSTDTLDYGTTIVPFEPSPIAEHFFSEWVGLPEDLKMPDKDLTVTGSYINYADLMVVKSASAGHGSVTRSVATDTIIKGRDLTLTAKPDEGYHFDHWSDGSNENPWTFVVTQHDSITAYFEINKYDVTWKNYNDTVLLSNQVEHGGTPVYDGDTPVKVANAQYTYSFKDGTQPLPLRRAKSAILPNMIRW